MITRTRSLIALTALIAASLTSGIQSAAADDTNSNLGPLYSGPYAAVMGRYLHTDDHTPLDHGFGATVAVGDRIGMFAFEAEGTFTSPKSATLLGGSLDGLFFPFQNLGLFAIAGVGAVHYSGYPYSVTTQILGGILGSQTTTGEKSFNTFAVNAGLGYILPLQIGRYQFGLRADARYRYGKIQGHSEYNQLGINSNFHDIIANVGLQLPFSLMPPPPPPAEPEPVKVVPTAPPADSDGDGVPDSLDQCPGTPPGTAVDKKGCPLPPPCKPPAPGERISLAGCGTGDVIVLRGVNFQFDKARLTVNAKTLLNGVASELKKYPDINVEVGGYTDSKGSNAYNKKLSQRRADSVKKYFIEQGIAADRMTTMGYGESNPVADNSTDSGRELNRRVELKITGGEGAATSSTESSTTPAPAASAPAESAPAPAAPASAAAPVPANEPESTEAPAPAATTAAPASAAAPATEQESTEAPAAATSTAKPAPKVESTPSTTPAPSAPPSQSNSLDDILGAPSGGSSK